MNVCILQNEKCAAWEKREKFIIEAISSLTHTHTHPAREKTSCNKLETRNQHKVMSFSSQFNSLQCEKAMNEGTQKMKILYFPSPRVMTEMDKSTSEDDNAVGDSSQQRNKQPM